ncbi:MAG: SIS domain-containing protein [Geothrix sp.]|uniref:SIS domain-containing protein n=1 Tax=Geothrix sp. TaxID=1962974 RepID=UPI001851D71A|nr:SIS domain-containing protein [Geothrix sp.]NWJ41889.1 SIS domain-containing protein [Geothrix sp.]WIL20138.1 MAG: SIS domain-containing protein [Geothrix sp.]
MSAAFSTFAPPSRPSLGAVHTIPEILGQPALWQATWEGLRWEAKDLKAFMTEALQASDREVVLTGAGSSAFIGELLQGCYSRRLKRCVRAVPTTDIVTNPEECFAQDVPTLLISFGRSGNSPESIAALDRADECLSDVRHLIITCNPGGDLAKHPTKHPRAVFVLPPAADDKGLAMTGSFTSMALAGMLMADLDCLEYQGSRVRLMAAAAERLLSSEGGRFRELARLGVRRAIFLGAGALKGAARECHLKVQELTNGSVMCSYDSFLGFRHGPKAAIDAETLVVFLFSGRPGQKAYEQDLVKEIRDGNLGCFRLGVGAGLAPHEGPEATITLDEEGLLRDEERAICGVLVAQVLGVELSIAQGLSPDNPSPCGSISRVVQGVTIYPRAHDPL